MKSETVEICPKTDKKLYSQCRSNWPQILLPISGLLALGTEPPILLLSTKEEPGGHLTVNALNADGCSHP